MLKTDDCDAEPNCSGMDSLTSVQKCALLSTLAAAVGIGSKASDIMATEEVVLKRRQHFENQERTQKSNTLLLQDECNSVYILLSAISKSPKFRESSSTRIAVLHTINSLLSQTGNQEHFNLQVSPIGAFSCQAFRSSIRDLRISAAFGPQNLVFEQFTYRSVTDKFSRNIYSGRLIPHIYNRISL
jgi:hypothetical protein